jgi:ADP-heptose:LPS heptosyltransferase
VPSPAPGAVVVHPGASSGSRRWPVGRFAAVAAELRRAGHPVVVTGGAAEREVATAVAVRAGLPPAAVLAGRTDLPGLAALVAGARLVVCGDTGVGHLASAYRTPSVLLFGPVPAAEWGPPADRPQHVVLRGGEPGRRDPHADVPDPGLLAVTVPDVLAAAEAAVSTRGLAGAAVSTRGLAGAATAP